MREIIYNIEVITIKGGKNLNYKLDMLKDELNNAVNASDIDMEKILGISDNIDDCIIKYYIEKEQISS